MNRFTSILLFISLLSSTVQAKIWIVDNTGKLSDYKDTPAAISAASAGDTIFLGGGGSSYTSLNLTKKLCLIGPGYFLTENPGNNEYSGSASMISLTLSSGSDGSSIIGLRLTYCFINANNTLVKRCFSNSTIAISGSNNLFIQNYFLNETSTGATVTVTGINNVIRNNAIFGFGVYNRAINSSTANIIENNSLSGVLTITESTVGNNILFDGSATLTNCTVYNNIGNLDQFGVANGNKSNVNMTTVFVSTGSTDGKWQLAAASPAKGAAYDGTDCGMFGGTDPYVLSGIPDIPFFSSIIVPGRTSTGNGLNVKISIKANK